MPMTKKHFVRLAAMMKEFPPNPNDAGQVWMWERMVERLARVCMEENPRFNRGSFLAACGYPVFPEDRKGE